MERFKSVRYSWALSLSLRLKQRIILIQTFFIRNNVNPRDAFCERTWITSVNPEENSAIMPRPLWITSYKRKPFQKYLRVSRQFSCQHSSILIHSVHMCVSMCRKSIHVLTIGPWNTLNRSTVSWEWFWTRTKYCESACFGSGNSSVVRAPDSSPYRLIQCSFV